MDNNYADLLAAIAEDPALADSLSAATTDDEKRSVLEDAGLTPPTQADYDDYVSSDGGQESDAARATREIIFGP